MQERKQRNVPIERDGKLFFVCKKCWIEKELTSEFWRKESKVKMWFNSTCKSCLKPIDRIWRANNIESARASSRKCAKRYHQEHKEEEKIYSKKYRELHRDEIKEHMKRYREVNKDKLRESRRKHWIEVKEKRKIRYENNKMDIIMKDKKRKSEKWYSPVHLKVNYVKKKLWLKPTCCSLCWYKWYIVSHHPDYNKPYNVVFCCQSCHKLIHSGEISVPNEKIISLEDLYKWRKRK